MDFDDLLTDVDLECPSCNRKFQQKGRELRNRPSIDCPTCGEPVTIEGIGGPPEPTEG